uniref:Cuticle protein CPCFC domain-containing protein n=1 Tax=Megaselia scalaris TaxID=36166 RepID=T1H666_MEGSC
AFLSLIVLISGQHQQAPQYPAGVDPAACPGFPICDNNLLHNPQARWAQPQQPQPQWNTPQWPTPAPSWPTPSWDAPVSNHLADGSGGDKYPAGVNPQACPNYPFCDTNAVHGGAAATPAPPLPGWNERQYPAGVSPQECPNFPYCH